MLHVQHCKPRSGDCRAPPRCKAHSSALKSRMSAHMCTAIHVSMWPALLYLRCCTKRAAGCRSKLNFPRQDPSMNRLILCWPLGKSDWARQVGAPSRPQRRQPQHVTDSAAMTMPASVSCWLPGSTALIVRHHAVALLRTMELAVHQGRVHP